MRYRLRTLMIVLAVLPPLLWLGWGRYQAWKAEQDRRAALLRALPYVNIDYLGVLEFVIKNKPPTTPPQQGVEPITDEDRQAWEEAKAVSRALGAPQPVPLPEGY
jgi:hypothetical protein